MSFSPIELATSGLVAPHFLANRISGGAYRLWKHNAYIGQQIANAVQRGNARLLINLGPGTGKSELISVATPTWFLARWPHKRVILGSASQPLATQWGSRNRQNFRDHPELGVQTRDDTDAKADWLTVAGGGMRAIGVGTSALGFRGDLFIIDDPYGTWADAQSAAYRKEVEEWYTGTATSRLEPGATVIVLHHRMHPSDLSNFLLKGEDGARWQHICLPSIATSADVLGRQPGDALCPERFDVEALKAKRLEMRQMWDPMHQQDPSASSAGACYSHFGPHNVDPAAAFNPALPLHLSVDFNISPGMHVLLGQHDRASDVASCFDEIFAPRMNVGGACMELSRRMASWPVKPPEIHVYGDATGTAKSASTGQSHYDALFRGLEPLGIPIRNRVPPSNPPVVDRVNTMNYALRDVDGGVWFKVHPRCERLTRDLAKVMHDAKGGIDKLSDPDLTHASDAEGYRMHTLRGFRPAIKAPRGRFGY